MKGRNLISRAFGLINWSGAWKWWAAGLLVFLGLVGVVLFQHQKIQSQRTALVVASEQLRVAATQIRVRDNLIYSTVQSGGIDWTNAEEKCLAQIKTAYDAGLSSAVADAGGVQRSIREKQAAGAFAGSVPGKGPGGSPG